MLFDVCSALQSVPCANQHMASLAAALPRSCFTRVSPAMYVVIIGLVKIFMGGR